VILNEQHKHEVRLLRYIKVTLTREQDKPIAPSECGINRVQVLRTTNNLLHLKVTLVIINGHPKHDDKRLSDLKSNSLNHEQDNQTAPLERDVKGVLLLSTYYALLFLLFLSCGRWSHRNVRWSHSRGHRFVDTDKPRLLQAISSV
jgi:hypothetical protein